jgi:hypothetical protein
MNALKVHQNIPVTYYSVSWQSVSTFIRNVWLSSVWQHQSSGEDAQQSSMARTLVNALECIGTWSSYDGNGCWGNTLSRWAGSPCRWSRVEAPIRYLSAANAHCQDDLYGWLKSHLKPGVIQCPYRHARVITRRLETRTHVSHGAHAAVSSIWIN